jgi:hypothetical protein
MTTASVLLLSTLGAAAAIVLPTPTPLPGACVLGVGNCAAIIATGSAPQLGNPGITLGYGGTGYIVVTVPSVGLVGSPGNQVGNFYLNPPSPGGMWTSVTRSDHPSETQTISVLAADGVFHATQFNFSLGGMSALKTTGSKETQGVAGTGTATMFPRNSDGYSAGMALQGTMKNGNAWPITSVSFVLSDPNNTGHYEYISIDYAVMQSILGSASSKGMPIGPVWVPLSPSGGSGNPQVISVNPALGPGGTFYTSEVLAPATGYGQPGSVPALSTWGIAGLTLLLAATGFLQLRKTGFQLGL